MIEKQVDILIIGGGLTGAILQLALVGKGYSILLIDSNRFSDKIDANFDARTLALSPASAKILDMLQVWPLLEQDATPIHAIHVSDQHYFGATRLHAQMDKPLGYVVEMQYINRALYQLIEQENVLAPAQLIELDKHSGLAMVTTQDEEVRIQAKLVVAADGADSTVRRLVGLSAKNKDYNQHALVANIELARSHNYQAYERFTSAGPLALLPMTKNRVSLVWAQGFEAAKRLTTITEKEFLRALHQTFGYRLGRFLRAGQRTLFPLRQVVMQQQTRWPFVFVGNAAHALHPVAGQGFNLGLRDVATLAQCIVHKGLDEGMLRQYEAMRQHDQRSIIALTDGLVKIFTSRLPGMAFARNLGLIAMDNFSVLKKGLSYYTRGFAGITPDLVCGIDLHVEEAK
ncbi:2-octaprenyl-6-methoxyphenol hydroxylase [Legionella lansingensis]|uniref:2-octaprenyl-6-methoxyphenol hydroxylase n=1 Tax=Legionella lansingensis TaxID=45067 RepID=A0A0W0VF56_9GAMM|nr:2-octaprenyl-6-methoxyphenyl hydroxylase [Legionella lansingensis]KTD18752.1 2-octaprenyl-6-methoxyphenol hydroxylase [Legionella lansingensis]SNV58511.1 2-octaprenyl-6-methoxyphenol hydroxylase [Legionella lansingensis]